MRLYTAWADATRYDTFYETSPGDNAPAKVRTIVRTRATYRVCRTLDPSSGLEISGVVLFLMWMFRRFRRRIASRQEA